MSTKLALSPNLKHCQLYEHVYYFLENYKLHTELYLVVYVFVCY